MLSLRTADGITLTRMGIGREIYISYVSALKQIPHEYEQKLKGKTEKPSPIGEGFLYAKYYSINNCSSSFRCTSVYSYTVELNNLSSTKSSANASITL